jgi:hypothetical protein
VQASSATDALWIGHVYACDHMHVQTVTATGVVDIAACRQQHRCVQISDNVSDV